MGSIRRRGTPIHDRERRAGMRNTRGEGHGKKGGVGKDRGSWIEQGEGGGRRGNKLNCSKTKKEEKRGEEEERATRGETGLINQ